MAVAAKVRETLGLTKALACTVTLPVLPPSTNNLYRTVPGKGRRKTKQYQGWLNAAGWELKAQALRHVPGDVKVSYEFGPRNRQRDLDNMAKALTDLLVSQGVIEDDRKVVRMSLAWGDVAGCVARVEAA